MTIFSSISGRGESTGYGVCSTLFGRCLGGAIRQKSPGSRVGLVARLKEATNAIGLLCLPAHQRL